MKKIIIAMMLILPMVASAQKFGHVNTQEIVPLMAEYKTMMAKLDSASSQLERELAAYQEEFQRKYQDFQAQETTMSPAMKQARYEELQEMDNRIMTFRQTAMQDLEQKQQQFFVPVNDKLNAAIKAVGEKEGFTYIFNAATLSYIATGATDVTPAVKKELGIK